MIFVLFVLFLWWGGGGGWGVTTIFYISVAKNPIFKHNWPFYSFLWMSLLLISVIITYQKFRLVVSPLPVPLKYHIIAAIVYASLIQRCINICLHVQLITFCTPVAKLLVISTSCQKHQSCNELSRV